MSCIRPTAEPYHAMSMFTFAFNVIVLPQLVQDTVCSNKFNSTVCDKLASFPRQENEVQKEAAKWMSYFPVTSLLPALFMVLMIGPISDIVGRRRIMLVPPLIYLIQSVIFIILTSIKKPHSPGIFLIPYCLTGLFGDNAGVVVLSTAYISSITKPEERTVRLGVLEASIFIGALTAAFSFGIVLSQFGFVGGFWMTAIMNFINLSYVFFLLPNPTMPELKHESIHIEKRCIDRVPSKSDSISDVDVLPRTHTSKIYNKQKILDLNPLKLLKQVQAVICERKRRNDMLVLLALLFIALFVNMGEVYTGMLYVKHSPFSMKPLDIAYLNTEQALLRALGVIAVPYLCLRYLKFKEAGLVILGFLVQVVYFTVFGLSVSRLMLYLIQIIAIPIAMHLPALRSMVSELVDPRDFGSAFSALEAIDVASSLFTSYISNQIYSETVHIFPGFAMCLLAGVAFIGLVVSIIYHHLQKANPAGSRENENLLS